MGQVGVGSFTEGTHGYTAHSSPLPDCRHLRAWSVALQWHHQDAHGTAPGLSPQTVPKQGDS